MSKQRFTQSTVLQLEASAEPSCRNLRLTELNRFSFLKCAMAVYPYRRTLRRGTRSDLPGAGVMLLSSRYKVCPCEKLCRRIEILVGFAQGRLSVKLNPLLDGTILAGPLDILGMCC